MYGMWGISLGIHFAGLVHSFRAWWQYNEYIDVVFIQVCIYLVYVLTQGKGRVYKGSLVGAQYLNIFTLHVIIM